MLALTAIYKLSDTRYGDMMKNIFFGNKKNETASLIAGTDLTSDPVPGHIAIIMDGNGRWAKTKGKPRTYGHYAGAANLKNILTLADQLGVKVLSTFAFSTENWKRPDTEVAFLMNLFDRYLTEEIADLMKNNVRVRFMGSPEQLPEALSKKMLAVTEQTADNSGIVLNLAVNYGGQDEIIRAVQKLALKIKDGSLSPQEINAECVEAHLDTSGLPRPDLLIRTGGDYRISNFMLWQIAYAEIWYTNTYWPDFNEEEFLQAINDYQKRDRRFGGLNDK